MRSVASLLKAAQKLPQAAVAAPDLFAASYSSILQPANAVGRLCSSARLQSALQTTQLHTATSYASQLLSQQQLGGKQATKCMALKHGEVQHRELRDAFEPTEILPERAVSWRRQSP